jgi:hypothetical protein
MAPSPRFFTRGPQSAEGWSELVPKGRAWEAI